MKQIKQVRKDIRWCDAFVQGEAAVKAQVRTWPLISSLKNRAMRPRHWQLLMEKTGKEFTPPYEDDTLELGEVLALNLPPSSRMSRTSASRPSRRKRLRQT